MNMLIFKMIFVGYILSCSKIFNVMIHIKNKNLTFDAFETFFIKGYLNLLYSPDPHFL